MTGDYNPQRESRLLSVPAEIRRAIYASVIDDCDIHVYLSEGKIQLSTCLQPNLGEDYRRPMFEDMSQPEWARRLRSSWGPHWECEEVAFPEIVDSNKQCRNQFHHLLFVCKKMSYDVCDFLFEETTINVTDLDTLDRLLQKPDESSGGFNRSWNLWDSIHFGITKLNVTFRLPLAFYNALEKDCVLESTLGSHTHAVSKMCATWECLWPAICQMQHLRKLCIWLDHDDKSSWSVVKERLALQGITTALEEHMQTRARDGKLPHIDITLNLPNLHPRIAKPDTHFAQQDIPASFTLERRIRQRYHCREYALNYWVAEFKPDFPIMLEIEEFYDETQPNDNAPMTVQEIEEMERGWGARGVDVDRLLVEEMGVPCYG